MFGLLIGAFRFDATWLAPLGVVSGGINSRAVNLSIWPAVHLFIAKMRGKPTIHCSAAKNF
jgi:hypothetical protein